MTQRITFIGLGVMGFPMAGHLAKAGFDVTVANRTAKKRKDWLKAYPGREATNLLESVANADLVITCLGDDQSLLNTFCGETGVLSAIKSGATIIDHTTTSARIAEFLYTEAEKHHVHFVDAPVSGGEQGAINGKLTIMCGGQATVFEKIAPVLKHYGRAVTHMGPAGAGQRTKMVNQITIAGLIQGLAEGLHFAERAGLDPEKVIEVISQGAAQSWQMENRHKTMIKGQYNHGFAVDLMRKDLRICFEEARENGSTLPVAALVDQFYADIQQMGGSRWDTSSLLARLNKRIAQ